MSTTARPSAPGSHAPPPISDPALRKQLESARGVASALLKGIKTIGMYRHNTARFGEYLHKAHEALGHYLQSYGVLQLRVDIANLTLSRHELFTEDQALPYKFFKDGIRQLIFRPGFTIEELVTFTVIALSDPDRGSEELNVQLWKAQLPHFEYVMGGGFRMDEFSEEEVQAEVDRVVHALQRRLETHAEESQRFSRVRPEDLDAQSKEAEQLRGLVVAQAAADPDLRARVQKEIADDEGPRLYPKLINAVFQVVEAGADDAVRLADMFTQLLDAMLQQEDFAAINQILLRLETMEQRSGPESPVGVLLRTFTAAMSDAERLGHIGEILKFRPPKSPSDCSHYLSTVSARSLPLLLDLLELIEVPENRSMLCESMVPCARADPAPFVARLEATNRPQMQRDMVQVLDQSNHPDKLRFFSKVLTSGTLELKLEVMAIIARGRGVEARKLIAGLLEDPTREVRVQAARVLPEFDRDQALVDLMRVVKHKGFEKKATEEREAIYSAIASTGAPGALSYFAEVLKVKPSLFTKNKVLEDKLLALAGLGGAPTIQTAKLLQEAAEDPAQPEDVHRAARKQLSQVRKALFGHEKGA